MQNAMFQYDKLQHVRENDEGEFDHEWNKIKLVLRDISGPCQCHKAFSLSLAK
jgi:hypothetical protein